MELYGRVRRAVLVDGLSQRSVAREFGILRKSVRKMVSFSVPPGYRREQSPARPKLDAYVGVIDAILEEDRTRPAKQRHTAKRLWERLKEEHQFTGGYMIVKDYLRSSAERSREMFVPLVHPAGQAQADFGEALAVIGGVECKAHYLAMDLPPQRTKVGSPGTPVCHTRTTALSSRFRPRRPKRFLKVMCGRSHTSAVCRRGSSTTTRRSRWRRSWAARNDSVRGPSPSSRATTCLPTSSDVLPKATIRGRWKG